MPQRYAVRVRLAAPAEVVAALVGHWGDRRADRDGDCLLTMNIDTLEWPVMILAGPRRRLHRRGARRARSTLGGRPAPRPVSAASPLD